MLYGGRYIWGSLIFCHPFGVVLTLLFVGMVDSLLHHRGRRSLQVMDPGNRNFSGVLHPAMRSRRWVQGVACN